MESNQTNGTHSDNGWAQIRGWVVHCHILFDSKGAYLIDGGFINAVARIETSLLSNGRSWIDLKAILLTHGHLDHTLNIDDLQHRSGAEVYAPMADQDHISGTYKYKGMSRFCGWSEALGRKLLSFTPPEIDHWIQPGDVIPIWGGLQSVALPGHTTGHTGFYNLKNGSLKNLPLASDWLSAFQQVTPTHPLGEHPNIQRPAESQSLARGKFFELPFLG